MEGILGIVLLVVLNVFYVGGSILFRKKGKPSIWNSLVFGVLVLLLAIIFKGFIFRLPTIYDTMSVVILVFSSIVSAFVGFYGVYTKDGKAYKWNVFFIRPVLLEIGFAGLVWPFLIRFPSVSFEAGILIVMAVEVILNLIDGENRMKLFRQIIYDIVVSGANILLIGSTASVWLAVIPRSVYALLRWYGGYRMKNSYR